jgi:hypothetical protein
MTTPLSTNDTMNMVPPTTPAPAAPVTPPTASVPADPAMVAQATQLIGQLSGDQLQQVIDAINQLLGSQNGTV